MIQKGGTMTVGELIAKLSEFNLDMPVLIKSLEPTEDVNLTLFENIREIKKEGIVKGEGVKVPIEIYDAVVITPTFDNRE
jgi:hypothetical protein